MKIRQLFHTALLPIILTLALCLTTVCSADENCTGNPHTASWLDEDMVRTIESLRRVDKSKMKSILMAAAQDMAYEKTTQTQYSGIYNNIKGTLTLWSFQDYDHEYHFSIDPKTNGTG